MKRIVPAIALSLLCANACAADGTTPVSTIRNGDRITRSLQKYTQETPTSKPVLEEKIASTSYTIESGAGDERVLRSRNGAAEILGKDLALIATINKNGERKDIDPETVKHWMPTTELKPGMKWSFSERHEQVASNSTKMCQWFGEYDAVSYADERDQNINGSIVRLPVIVIEVRGRVNIRNCVGSGSDREERYVYSRDLDLVLEHSSLSLSSYGKLLGSSQQLSITSISTGKKVALLTPAP
ncbi:hypothetical protein [Uliginosibacterium sp. 31-12]|uniref:hypothetical protein n=1 Tax=Uliginosibacterium sp. 31-12 TaxID=3062781 RepID=UPI0026E47F81|nr:hypothetical protein [Uliginosibacterium sp. 31-12]MDO6387881.1 hypothetical protein [Uliginosibacterium sp. 31-12]